MQAWEENFQGVGLQEVKNDNGVKLRRKIYIDLTSGVHTLAGDIRKHKGTHIDLMSRVFMLNGLREKLSSLKSLDAEGYNLVVVVCDRGRHWSPAIAELVTEYIGRRMYPEDSKQVQCLHLQQWDQWIPVGESKICPMDCKHCDIFKDDFSHSSIGPHTDCSHWQPHSARYNGNFTSEHLSLIHI